MVFVWSYLTDGDPAYTSVQVYVNNLIFGLWAHASVSCAPCDRGAGRVDRGQQLFRIGNGNGHCAVRSRIRSGVGNGCRRTRGSAVYVVGLWDPQSDQALVHARGGRMKPRVVFLCTSNSALSQMADGW